jgi:hypothetical protein
MIALRLQVRTLAVAGAMAVLALPAAAQNTWTTSQSMPVHRYKHGAAALGSLVHVVGGVSVARGCTYLSTHDVYDPGTNMWSAAAPMTTARTFAGVAPLDGKLYVVGGETACASGSQTSGVEVYDPLSSSWSAAASLPSARSRVGVVAVNHKLYAVGGYDGAHALDAVDVYDPATNTWSSAAPIPVARRDMAIASVDGLIYVAGGFNDAGNALSGLEIFNPATGTWTDGPAMSLARGLAGGGVVNHQFWVIGGFYFQFTAHTVSTVSIYDPATNTWTNDHQLPAARDEMGTATTPGAIYVLGGWTGSTVSGDTLSFATDTLPPVLTLPSDMVVDPTSPAGAAVTYVATANDNVDGQVPVSCAPASGSLFAIGTTTVSCSASDTHGNTASGSFSVTVRSASQIASELVTATEDPFQQGIHLLQNAERSISAPHPQAACGQLQAFINQVQAQAGKQLANDVAASWVASANAARAALGCE